MTGPVRRLHPDRWNAVKELAVNLCQTNTLPGLAIATGTADSLAGVIHTGRQKIDQPGPIRDDAIFLIASITKPIVGMAALLLIERGCLALADRVADLIPEFGRKGKYGTEIRHLLTHSSGLCDMLPDNVDLRKSLAPLKQFVERTCEEPPSFPPGRGVQYQSMGFAMLGEIILRVSGKPCAEFLRDEFFEPLGMLDTTLGAPDSWFDGHQARIERIAEGAFTDEPPGGADWTRNSRYWRGLGVPWGGVLSTVTDLSLYAQFMLRMGSTSEGRQLVSPATVRAATRNQLECMRDIPEFDRRCRPWGLGWRLDWQSHSENFSDLAGPRTYGHWGATGTVMWIDPDAGIFTVILNTLPQDQSCKYLTRLSNAVAAAWQ